MGRDLFSGRIFQEQVKVVPFAFLFTLVLLLWL